MTDSKPMANIEMHCPTCDGLDFEFSPNDGPITCIGCGRSFDRDELIRENGRRIQAEAESIVQEFSRETISQIKKKISKLK